MADQPAEPIETVPPDIQEVLDKGPDGPLISRGSFAQYAEDERA